MTQVHPRVARPCRAGRNAGIMSPMLDAPVTVEERGEVFLDARGNDRALRVSWHPEADIVVLSIWRAGTCAGTFRLNKDDVRIFVDALVDGMRAEPSMAGAARPAAAGRHAAPDQPEQRAADRIPAPSASARPSFMDWAFGGDETGDHATAS